METAGNERGSNVLNLPERMKEWNQSIEGYTPPPDLLKLL
jgi:hypothetical protein